MAFTPKVWAEEDPITAAELNRVETGVDDAHDDIAAIRASFYSVAFDGDGTPRRMPTGFSVARTATGRYTVTHPLGTAAFAVAAGADRGSILWPSGTIPTVHTRFRTSTTFQVYVTDQTNALVDVETIALIVFPYA